jgi:hypothetical protein
MRQSYDKNDDFGDMPAGLLKSLYLRGLLMQFPRATAMGRPGWHQTKVSHLLKS